MRDYLINGLYAMLRWYVSTGIFDRLAALVQQLSAVDIPGAEKRAQVIAFAEAEFDLVWGASNRIVLDAVIAIARLKQAQSGA